MSDNNLWELLSSKSIDAKVDNSKVYKQHDRFYAQSMTVRRDIAHYSRHNFFANICANKKVLHVGCTDYPFVSVEGSMHLYIEKFAELIDGLDVDTEGLKILEPHTKGDLYSDWSKINKSYDLILAPEVLEHVDNVQTFISNINSVDCKNLIMTAPDAYSCFSGHFEYVFDDNAFIEIVHKDHNAWYSPFTIKNVIEKYSDYRVQSFWFFYGRSILVFATK